VLCICTILVLYCVVYGIFETCLISSCHLTGFLDLQNKYVFMYIYKQSKKEYSSCFIFILGMLNPEAEGTTVL